MKKEAEEALLIGNFALDKKAQDIIILDMRKISDMFTYFVICSGASSRQTRAIADGIIEETAKKGWRLWHAEGLQEGNWILLDFGGIVAHIFYEHTRRFYNLELLWSDAPQIKL